MAIRLPLVMLAALSSAFAAPALATSPVETARAQERIVEPLSAEDESPIPPESPLAIAEPLAARDTGLQIQLGSSEPASRSADLLELPADVSLEN